MKPLILPIDSPATLGKALRAARKHQRLRQDEVGSLSHSFIGEVESGKPTAQIGKVFELLRELGARLSIQLPPGVPYPDSASDPVKAQRKARAT